MGKDVLKLRRNAMVDWRDVRVNGRPLEFVHPLNIIVNKPVGMRSTDAEDYAAYVSDARPRGYYTPEDDQDHYNSTVEYLHHGDEEESGEVVMQVDDDGSGSGNALHDDDDDDGNYYDEEEEEEEHMEVYVEYDEEGELFDVMPKLFPFRKPSFQIFSPLPNDVAGLTLLTQDGTDTEWSLLMVVVVERKN